jgi:hypothetical protein
MKKCIAMILCLALALGCAAGFTEEKTEKTEKELLGFVRMGGNFELRCRLPEGYAITAEDADVTHYLATVSSEEKGKPVMFVSIAYDELMSGVDRLNDLDEAALKKIEASFREEDEVEITYRETAHGTKLMVVREVKDGTDYVDFYTVYRGYGIELVLTGAYEEGGEPTPLTEEQIRMVIDFLSDLDFVETEPAA